MPHLTGDKPQLVGATDQTPSQGLLKLLLTYKKVNMSKLYNSTETWAHLGGVRGVADHLIRLPVVSDIVLLLVEKGEACRDVTGHQVCVLGGRPQCSS